MSFKDPKQLGEDGAEAAKVEDIFKEMRGLAPRPNPFLATRVLAIAKERKKAKRSPLGLGFLLGSASMAGLALLAFFLLTPGSYNGVVGQQMAIWVDTRDVKKTEVAFVQIVLPNGVHFEADGMPELRELRQLTVAWSEETKSLPFVIQSGEEGTRAVEIRYLNSKKEIVKNSTLKIRFKKQDRDGTHA